MALLVAGLKAVLEADATLTTYLTGGVHTRSETGVIGINRDTNPTAFEGGTGKLLPCVVLNGRMGTPTQDIRDEANQVRSIRVVFELYFLDDAHAGYSTIESARAQSRRLLDMKRINGAFIELVNFIEDIRDPDLNNACGLRDDYATVQLLTA